MRLPCCAVLIGALALGCRSTIDPTFETMAYGVRVTTTIDPTQLAGLGIDVSMLNTGDATVFLDRCGDEPLLIVDEWVSGNWERRPMPDCAPGSTPGPLTLQSGAVLKKGTSFATAGRFRVGIRVSPNADFTVPREALSAPFDVN